MLCITGHSVYDEVMGHWNIRALQWLVVMEQDHIQKNKIIIWPAVGQWNTPEIRRIFNFQNAIF